MKKVGLIIVIAVAFLFASALSAYGGYMFSQHQKTGAMVTVSDNSADKETINKKDLAPYILLGDGCSYPLVYCDIEKRGEDTYYTFQIENTLYSIEDYHSDGVVDCITLNGDKLFLRAYCNGIGNFGYFVLRVNRNEAILDLPLAIKGIVGEWAEKNIPPQISAEPSDISSEAATQLLELADSIINQMKP